MPAQFTSLRILLTAFCIGLPMTSLAQTTWPDHPIRFVVHSAAGGNVDLLARILADRLAQQLPQRVLIENIGGAGGALGARAVAKAEPDGYTFLFAGPGHASVPFVQKQPPYDPVQDFSPVSLVAQFPLAIIINRDLPAKDLEEFITLIKQNPNKYAFGHGGTGGSSHIPIEALMYQAGIKMIPVPFRGNAPASAALLGGQIHLIIDGLTAQVENIESGRVRAIAVTTKERTAFLPDVPTVSETLPGYKFPMRVALFAPAKTPKHIVDKLSEQVSAAMKDPATRARYQAIKVDPVGSTPEELDSYFRRQLEFNDDIIRKANIKEQ
jgi:tripartite-type tricarboxylate transporter receptor subunit TctC